MINESPLPFSLTLLLITRILVEGFCVSGPPAMLFTGENEINGGKNTIIAGEKEKEREKWTIKL